MKIIDHYILKKFQKVSDWFQLTFGINNFTIVRIFVVLFAASGVIATVIKYEVSSLKGIDPSFILFLVAYSSVFFIASVIFEKVCLKNPQFANPLKGIMEDLRLLSLGITLFGLVVTIVFSILVPTNEAKTTNENTTNFPSAYNFYFWLIIISWFVIIYLISCTPKPPSKSKFKKLLEGLQDLSTKKELVKI